MAHRIEVHVSGLLTAAKVSVAFIAAGVTWLIAQAADSTSIEDWVLRGAGAGVVGVLIYGYLYLSRRAESLYSDALKSARAELGEEREAHHRTREENAKLRAELRDREGT